jgi:hypothetical protein
MVIESPLQLVLGTRSGTWVECSGWRRKESPGRGKKKQRWASSNPERWLVLDRMIGVAGLSLP